MRTDLARSGTMPQEGLVAELLSRTINDGSDRLAWLEARQGRVTATMARELVRGGLAARKRIIAESFVPPVEIRGNRYIDRGHEREPVIASWIARGWPITANAALIASPQNDRHASTPDGIGVIGLPRDVEEGRIDAPALVVSEIKTSKHDLDPSDPHGYFWGTGYFEQMQWQMYTCGARRTLFVWEQHDDGWPNPVPIDLEPRWTWIDRDEALIERMIAAADAMLAERDKLVAQEGGAPGEPVVNVELESLAIAVLDARVEKKLAEDRLAAPWQKMLALLAGREEFTQRTGLAQITWSTSTTARQEIDEQAALDAPVGGLPGMTGADLLADVMDNRAALAESDLAKALRASELVWESHRAEFARSVAVSNTKLTVTAPKGAER